MEDRYYRASTWVDQAGYGTLWACAECGLHVEDPNKHSAWHEALALALATLSQGVERADAWWKPLGGGRAFSGSE